jgi:hypothetical protein
MAEKLILDFDEDSVFLTTDRSGVASAEAAKGESRHVRITPREARILAYALLGHAEHCDVERELREGLERLKNIQIQT